MQRLLHTIFFFIFRYRATIMRLTMVILVSVIPRALYCIYIQFSPGRISLESTLSVYHD